MSRLLQSLLRQIAALRPRRRPRVADEAGLAARLAAEAAFVSQKCTIEYLRLRAGLGWEELCSDAAFRAGLERCRWEAFALALGEVAELCEMCLRHQGVAPMALERIVPPAVAGALRRYPVPAHRASWDDVEAAIGARLAAARLEPPHRIRFMGAATARRLMELYPFDERLREADLDYLHNNLRLALGQVYERMSRELDVAKLVGPAGLEPATRPL